MKKIAICALNLPFAQIIEPLEPMKMMNIYDSLLMSSMTYAPIEPPTRKQAQFIGRVEKVRTEAKIGRNQSCPCNSGKKYKQCCI
jgi:preprotein translocase subunit SecA